MQHIGREFSSFMEKYKAMFSAFLLASAVNEEKKDKVFEQIFVAPLSPLKLLLYHFIALIPLIILAIAVGYVSTAIFIVTFVSDVYLSYILRGFVLSLVFTISLCYVLFLNSMVMPSKYSSLLPMFLLLLSFLTMQSICSVFGTATGLFTLSTIIVSIVFGNWCS